MSQTANIGGHYTPADYRRELERLPPLTGDEARRLAEELAAAWRAAEVRARAARRGGPR